MHSNDHRANSTNNAGFPPAPSEAHRLAVVTGDWHGSRSKMALEARVLFATARLYEAIQMAAGELTPGVMAIIEDKFDDAYAAAYMVGEGDFKHGILQMPSCFSGTALQTPWKDAIEAGEGNRPNKDNELEEAIAVLEAIFAKARA